MISTILAIVITLISLSQSDHYHVAMVAVNAYQYNDEVRVRVQYPEGYRLVDRVEVALAGDKDDQQVTYYFTPSKAGAEVFSVEPPFDAKWASATIVWAEDEGYFESEWIEVR